MPDRPNIRQRLHDGSLLARLWPAWRHTTTTAAQSVASGASAVEVLRCAVLFTWLPLSAVRYDPVFQRFYQRLRGTGKKPLVALVAVMRKLIILLNHLLKNPALVPQHAT